VIVNQVKELEKDKGFDAQNEKFVNMVEAGIIDPTKVVRSALQNASSIASLMLTTEAVINELPEEDKKTPPGMGRGMGDEF
jgi:chaperonin GroEL